MNKLLGTGLTILTAGLMILIVGCGPGVSSTAVPSSPPEVRPGPAVKLAFTTQPVGAVAGSDFEVQPVVAVEDAEGNVVTSYRGLVVLTITASTGVSEARLFGGTKVGLVNGMVEFKGLSIDKARAGYTLTATSDTLLPATSTPLTILPGEPDKLVFTVLPSRGEAGAPLMPNPEVMVQDIYGNTVANFEGSVTISASVTYGDTNDPQTDPEISPVTLSGTTTVRMVNGVVRFTDISSKFATIGYPLTLTAASNYLASATSTPFAILPGAPAKLVFTVQPTGGEEGTPFEEQPKVAVKDIYGNVVSSSRASITLSITSDSGTAGAVLSGTTTLVADGGFFGGLAVFTDLSIDQAGSGYLLTATSSGLTSAISQAFDVSTP
ncbi:hypothetical protein ACFLUO_04125 [Chloroflexota bacterium]